MTTGSRSNLTARLALALLLLLAGAALAIWGLSRWEAGARFFGVAPRAAGTLAAPPPLALVAPPAAQPQLLPADAARLAAMEARLAGIERTTQQAAGSVGRADALLVAFAARRAIDRGVALGYLEPLLAERFGASDPQAVAAIVTASRDPVRIDTLVADYEALGDRLRGPGPGESWWTGVQRELGSIVAVRRADTPSGRPQARYDRALERLRLGQVDAALAETMRLPGAANAGEWVARARRYVIAHRALDRIESAALLGGGRTAP